MKLASKLTLALILGILVVMSGYAYLQLRREVVLYEGDLERFQQRGKALAAMLQNVWATEGKQRVEDLVEVISSVIGDCEISWVQLDAPPGDPAAPRLSAADLAAVRAGEVRRVVHRDADGGLVRYIYVPMAAGGSIALQATEQLRRESIFIHLSHVAVLAATVVITLVCGLIAMGLGFRLVGRPVRLLRDQARRMAAGDFSGRLAFRQRDEIGELAEDMNALCVRLDEANRRIAAETEARVAAIEQLRHADRLATVGQLGAGVAHELGTPLNVIAMRAKAIAAPDASPEEIADGARVIDEQAERMAGIVRQLLDFSRRGGGTPADTDPRDVVAQSFDLLSAAADAQGVTLDMETTATPLVVHVDENRLLQALANVVMNAIQATPAGGRVTVRVGARPVRPPRGHPGPAGEYVFVVVEDTGTGIRPEDLPRVLEPFFTTKGPGEGTGLGLAVADGIVAEHGGWIEVESTPTAGSRFTVFLPRAGGAHGGVRRVAS